MRANLLSYWMEDAVEAERERCQIDGQAMDSKRRVRIRCRGVVSPDAKEKDAGFCAKKG